MCLCNEVQWTSLREVWRVESAFDHSRINSQNGEDDAGEENQRQLVDILHADKHHQSHEGENDASIHTHVVEHCSFSFGAVQAFHAKYSRVWSYVDLQHRKEWKSLKITDRVHFKNVIIGNICIFALDTQKA